LRYADINFIHQTLLPMNIQTFTRRATAWMAALFFSVALFAQGNNPPASPALTATGTIGEASITINYGSPAVKGRKIWGALVPYNKVWRTGANGATTFETNKAVKIEGKELAAGKYALFTIPGETDWTIIFNKVSDQWGAYNYSEKDDALRVTVKSKKVTKMNERLGIEVTDSGFVIRWEYIEVPVSVK
jgi:hypothetical protein